MAEMNRELIGRRLRDLRGDAPQAEVASAVGVTVVAISQYERGERIPTDAIKVELARYFNQTVDSIFFTP